MPILRMRKQQDLLFPHQRLSEKWRSLVAYTQTKVDTERKNSSPVSTMIPHGELLLDLMYEYDKYSVSRGAEF